jgi:hypothetical protein
MLVVVYYYYVVFAMLILIKINLKEWLDMQKVNKIMDKAQLY